MSVLIQLHLVRSLWLVAHRPELLGLTDVNQGFHLKVDMQGLGERIVASFNDEILAQESYTSLRARLHLASPFDPRDYRVQYAKRLQHTLVVLKRNKSVPPDTPAFRAANLLSKLRK